MSANFETKILRKIAQLILLKQSGFSLVELVISLVMSGIVMIGLYVIVSGSHEYVKNLKKKIQLQQDVSLIGLVLGSNIRQGLYREEEIYASYADYIASQPTQSSGTCLKLYFHSGDSVLLFKDNTDFKIMNTDSTFTNLVPGVVDSLIFTQKPNSVETKLSLSQGTWSLENTFVAAFRNFGGLGNRKCELVIQASQVPANLTDFPVLLTEATLPSEMFDADSTYPALNGGGDIKFSSDQEGATRLSCEIVTFTTDNNPALGKAEIWVKVPTVSSSANTSIWVWYDKAGESQPAVNAEFGSESVWDANYVMVQHLNEDPSVAAPQMIDATSNNNDGTSGGSMTSGDLVDAQIGKGLDFDGINDYLSVADSASLGLTSSITIESWFNPTQTLSGTADYFQSLIDNGSYSLFFDKSDGKIKFALNSNTAESWTDVGGTALSSNVFAFGLYNGELVVGGEFTDAGGDPDADMIAKWNGTAWSDVGGGLSSKVFALAVYNGELYVGGEFVEAGGVSDADRIAKWNGTAWSTVGNSMLASPVYALTVYNGVLYVGGNFDDGAEIEEADKIAKWNGTAWSAVGGTALSGQVNALVVYNGELYVGGLFVDAAGDLDADRIAKWNGTAWSDVGGTGLSGEVQALAVYNGELYLAGYFVDAAGDPDADRIAKFSSGDDVVLGTTSTSWSASTWHHIAARYDGSSVTISVNATQQASTSTAITLADLSFDVLIGKAYGSRRADGSATNGELFNGLMDEARISSVARSADWIQTDYNNQNSPATFVIEGTPETP